MDYEEIRFFVLIGVVTLVIFMTFAVGEAFALKALKHLETPRNFIFSVAANVVGFIITCLVIGALAFLFLLLFAAAMGGGGGIAIGSVAGIVVSVASVPVTIFIARLILQRLFKAEKLNWVYALISTVLNVAFLIVIWTIVSFILANIGQT